MKAKNLAADAIHGDLDQSMRQRVLKNFREGKINVLIATDVAARGIDVPDITHVINYDMPLEAEAYVHRVGRTGRAGAQGVALSICVAKENALLRQIESLIGLKVPLDKEQPFHDDRPPMMETAKPRGRSFAGKSNGPNRFAKAGDKRPASQITPLRRQSA
jgi:ATP-dependent RNA helicase RhlE